MEANIYYRGAANGQLRQVRASDISGATGIAEAVEAVREDLKESGEVYAEPILALVKGGKNG